nr:hypothetical protein [Tanacetum cinerariifolium]
MKDVFGELEAEVTQYAVDRKHNAIERKNLLIANLIVKCLSQEVFSVATNSELNVARFTEMHVANTTVEARCLALEAELTNLRDKNNHDNQKELINHFSKHEVNHLNLQLKYQNLKDSIGNDLATSDKDTPDFDSVLVIGKMQASFQGKKNVISQLKKKLSQLQVTHSDTDRTLKTNVHVPSSIGVHSCPNANGSQPKSHVKPNRISQAKGVNKLPVEDQPSTNKSHLRTSNRVDSSSRLKRTVVQIVLWYLDLGCSKHMTGDRSLLMNFMKKFIETVRFENEHFGAIMGYGDYVIGDCVISRVKFLRSKDETPEVIIKFNTQIQVGLNKTVRYVRIDNGTDFVNHTLAEYYERIGIFRQKTVPRTLQQNGVVERRNRTLVEATRTMLIFSKALMFLWAHHKTPYELVHNKKHDLTFFRVFGALCYPTNDSEDLGKLQPTADTGIFVGYTPNRKGYRIYNKRTRRIMETIHVQFDELTKLVAPVHLGTRPAPNFMTPGQISLGLIPNLVLATPYAPPPIKNWRFYFSQCLMNIWNLFVLKDWFYLLKQYKLQSTQPFSVVAESNYMEDHNIALVDNAPFVNIFAPEPHSEASSSGDISSTESPYVVQIVLWYLDLGCSKHMTEDRSLLMNFMKKFIETVRFGNEHFGAIMGYGDYVIGDCVISRVYYVEGLGHNLFFVGVFGALCYPTNDSEDLGKLQPTADTGIFVGYTPNRKGYRIYNKRTRRIMETIHVQFDELTKLVAPVHLGTRPAPNFMTPRQISSGLPMFDEYLEPPRVKRLVLPAQAVQAPVNSAGTPSSTTIDKDAPSPSISPSSSASQSYSLELQLNLTTWKTITFLSLTMLPS